MNVGSAFLVFGGEELSSADRENGIELLRSY